MKWLILSLVMFMAVACGQLPKDNTPPPIDNNFYSLEMSSCTDNVGLLACGFKQEEMDKELVIPVRHTGELVISSEKCAFPYSKRFQDEKEIRIKYSELLTNAQGEDSCVYDVKLFIDDFAKGFRGLFVLYNTDGLEPLSGKLFNKPFTGSLDFQFKKGQMIPTSNLVLEAPFKGKVVLDGCGYSQVVKSFDKTHEIQLSELITKESLCVITAAMISDNEEDIPRFGKIIVSQYENVIPLTNPGIELLKEFGKEKLKVTGNPTIAGMGIDNHEKLFKGILAEKSLKVDDEKDKVHTVRMMTTNGRYLMIKVKNGEVVWIPKIFF